MDWIVFTLLGIKGLHVIKVETKMFVFSSVAEPEPVEPKLFETRSRSRNYIYNKKILQSDWRMLG